MFGYQHAAERQRCDPNVIAGWPPWRLQRKQTIRGEQPRTSQQRPDGIGEVLDDVERDDDVEDLVEVQIFEGPAQHPNAAATSVLDHRGTQLDSGRLEPGRF